jgi:hypothetical protein
MIRVIKSLVQEAVERDAIAVVIQASDGSQYVVDQQHLARGGRSGATRKRLETPARAAARVLRVLDSSVKVGDFAVLKSRALGKKHTHFVVWFAPHDFHVDEVCWDVDCLPEQAKSSFTAGQLHALKPVCIKAQKLHADRQAEQAA